jgi:aminopeptidase N
MRLLLPLLLSLFICLPATAFDRRHDEHSYAQPDKVKVTDLALELQVDFDKKVLSGTALLTLDWIDKSAHDLVLDTRDLSIEKIEGWTGKMASRPLRYKLARRDDILGSKLSIAMPMPYKTVRITYRTSPDASGLQWLDAPLTADKKLPFMFSQSESIHARSWVPLQDTPGVRFTYSANIHTPTDVMALMSADNDPASARDGDYSFRMPQPIPSYLLAIAAGDLVFKPISDRSGVWAEPSVVDKAAWEFADTEKMIDTAEKLYGPYRWGRYDILVLPPSFPFGGMENPRLTFATPTVIVGDRSQASLIAHELAHSWSGNLVTNASWKDMWLNEGFTTYVQGRIVEAVYGNAQSDMEDVLSEGDARAAVDDPETKPAQQLLRLAANPGGDPDDAASDIAYEKGRWFLSFLEHRYGREIFDPFLRSWFDQHAFQSATTDQFMDFLHANLLPKKPGAVSEAELHAWVDEPGIPAVAIATQSARFVAVDGARADWLAGTKAAKELDSAHWSTQEWVRFLGALPEKLTADQLADLDASFHLTGTPNGEIAMRWYPLTVRSNYLQARPEIARFVGVVGRRKLIMPIYEALATSKDGLAFARAVFAQARPGYHPITIASVQALLDRAKPEN